MTLILLESVKDTDFEHIKSVYNEPAVSRFVCIDKENFWFYITETENVYFYQVYNDGTLVGTVQCDLYDSILYLALVVFPEYQNKGIGTDMVKYVVEGKTGLDFKEIQVSIDETNTASVSLFEKAGFIKISQNDELIDYVYMI